MKYAVDLVLLFFFYSLLGWCRGKSRNDMHEC